MKIRQGFVSNSSSSSFVMVFKQDEFQNAFAKLSAEEQDFLKPWIVEGDLGNCKLSIVTQILIEGCYVEEKEKMWNDIKKKLPPKRLTSYEGW